MAYVADGEVVDGSWELNILVTDLQVEKTLRVMGDLHVGGVMLKLVQALGKFLFLYVCHIIYIQHLLHYINAIFTTLHI